MADDISAVHTQLRATLEEKIDALLEAIEKPSIFERDITTLLGTILAAQQVSDRLIEAERQLKQHEDALEDTSGSTRDRLQDRMDDLEAYRGQLLSNLSNITAKLKLR